MKFLMNQFSLILILSLSIALFSCGDDEAMPKSANEQANDDLSGTWIASSYNISGEEALGVDVQRLELTFGPSSDVGGTFASQTTFLNGTPSGSSATYTVVNDGDRIKIGTDTLAMVLTESSLELEGFLFINPGPALKIKATKE